MKRAAWIVAAFASVSACAWIAGLPDDVLAPPDGGAEQDSGADGSANEGGATDAGSDTAGDDVSPGDDAAQDAKGPKVPPSDPGNVACGPSKCALPNDVCCEAQDGSAACTPHANPSCDGVVAECDEAKSCASSQPCCITDVKPWGLEAQCRSSCNGPQSCRSNGECGGGHVCVAWMCAGRVVATCDGVGADAGCM